MCMSENGGVLSRPREWHSAVIGFAAGLVFGWSDRLRRDVQREPHYAVAAFVFAAVGIIVLRREESCEKGV